MADIIKDFVKKQTTPLTIGVPKQRPQTETSSEVARPAEMPAPVSENPVQPATTAPVRTEDIQKGRVGRPKSEVEKIKVSLYLPKEAKDKLVKIQHNNYRQSLNDVLLEAIYDIIKKYE